MKRNYTVSVLIVFILIQSLLLTMTTSAASEECNVELEKYAEQTKVISGGRNSSNCVFIQVGNHVFFDNIPHSRQTAGLYVVGLLDDKILLQSQYSMFADGEASIKLARDIERLPQNTFVVVAAKDEPTRNFNQRAQNALYQIGAEKGLLNCERRSSYLCLGIKGLKRGEAIEKVGMQELRYAGTELGKPIKFIFPSKPKTIIFEDHRFEEAIRDIARISPDKPITTKHLEDIAGFRICDRGIVNLDGIEYARSWFRLELRRNRISDISPISKLNNLRELYLHENEIVEIRPLSSLVNLEVLNLGTNKISNLSPIAELTNLKSFCASKNQISDISPLEKLSKIEALDLGNNKVKNIEPISNMKNLRYLHIPFNQVEDVTPLSKLTKLETLFIDRNNIKDISSLSNLIHLELFFIRDNHLIEDIGVVSNMKKLKDLSFYRNQIHDISPVASLTELIRLEAGKNPIKDISPIIGLTKLKILTLRETQVTNFTPLSKCIELTSLDLRGTDVRNLIPISKCEKLEYLNLINCQIDNIAPLAKLLSLKSLELSNNNIRNIMALTRLKNLSYLDIRSNPLNNSGYKIGIPKILRNNPGCELLSDKINTQTLHNSLPSHRGIASKKAVLIIASENFRDEELFETKTTLEKAKVKTVIASTKKGIIKGMLGATTKADVLIEDIIVSDYDVVVFIGGSGARELFDNQIALDIARQAVRKKKLLAAICVAPTILANAGVLNDVKATSAPSQKATMEKAGAEYTGATVEQDKLIITGNGPKAVSQFRKTIVNAMLVMY